MSRFVDVRPFEGTDAEYYATDDDGHDDMVGSTTIARTLGYGGPGRSEDLTGTVTHLAVLQPDVFDDRVRTMPDIEVLKQQFEPRVRLWPEELGNGRTKESKQRRAVCQADYPAIVFVTASKLEAGVKADLKRQWEKENEGKLIVPPSVYEDARSMRGGLMNHPLIESQVRRKGTVFEKSYTAIDSVTGIRVRTRPDAWNLARVWDLKTAKSPAFYAFARSVDSYGYFIQAAWELDILSQLPGVDDPPRSFGWLVVGKMRPHWAGVYGCDDSYLELGRQFYDAGLTVIAESRKRQEPTRPWWAVGGHMIKDPPEYLYDAAILHQRHADNMKGDNDDD